MDHNELWTAARRREAARIDIPGFRGFWRQRQVRERGIQLGLGLLFVDLGPFFFLFFHLALVFRFFLPLQVFQRLGGVVLLTNDSELVLEI